ncbi:helix-turn-helix domain-containing protein [Paenibacillus puerhi]|uniref:helix-turn-helix domain-containing protein n=1 Tax=Paenibacillus puerhi TaxID=2692622 RepID=UPI001359B4A2|nr:AraC family transcriptional regulator [Paenibacillus puerhi]
MMLPFIQRIKDRSVFVLSLVILLIFSASVFLYDQSVRSEYRKERVFVYQKNHEKAFSTLFLFTERLQSVYRQVLINREITEWLTMPGELVTDMYRLSRIQNSFIELINSHSGISSFYLHNKTNDLVLSTPYMLTELKDFPNHRVFEQFEYGRENEQWQWQTFDPDITEPNGSPIISMTAGLPSRNKKGAVAINVSRAYMADTLLEESPYLLWLDEQDRILLAGDARIAGFYNEHAKEIWATKAASFFYKDHLVITSASDTGKWKLLTIMPQQVLTEGGTEHKAYKYIILASCLALGLLLLLYFRLIRREQDKLAKSNLEHNLDDLRNGLVTDLLNGKPVLAGLEEKSKQYQINLRGAGYQVIVFQIDDYYNYLLTKTNSERFVMNKIIFNAIRWSFALKFNAHIMNTELEKVTVLICYDTPGEAAQERLNETIRYIQNDIKENCGLTVCVGVSEIADDVAHVHSCYAHAMLAVDYKSIYGKHSLIYYEQLSFTGSVSLPKLSQSIHQMAGDLEAGRLDRIESCLESILEELIADRQFTLDWIHALFANIMSVIMKFAIEHRIDIQQQCKEDPFITLYSYEFLEEKKAYVLKICALLIELVHAPHERVNSTGKMIIDYIDQHFDSPISLSMLAEKLSMSPSYLSVVIKNQLGIGFIDYISRLRIQKAIRLLENDDLTIQHIAEQCGYDTVHTFIRQFKKTYQLPPNEYRSRRRSENMEHKK